MFNLLFKKFQPMIVSLLYLIGDTYNLLLKRLLEEAFELRYEYYNLIFNKMKYN